jgi:DNA polymerase III gamma/tau subunit
MTRALFAEIVGQEMAVTILTRALEQGSSHCLFALWSEGVGKTDAALAFAAGLAFPQGGCGTCTHLPPCAARASSRRGGRFP